MSVPRTSVSRIVILPLSVDGTSVSVPRTSVSRIVILPLSVDGTSVCLFLEFKFLFF